MLHSKVEREREREKEREKRRKTNWERQNKKNKKERERFFCWLLNIDIRIRWFICSFIFDSFFGGCALLHVKTSLQITKWRVW